VSASRCSNTLHNFATPLLSFSLHADTKDKEQKDKMIKQMTCILKVASAQVDFSGVNDDLDFKHKMLLVLDMVRVIAKSPRHHKTDLTVDARRTVSLAYIWASK
jgi:hypothetical protein